MCPWILNLQAHQLSFVDTYKHYIVLCVCFAKHYFWGPWTRVYENKLTILKIWATECSPIPFYRLHTLLHCADYCGIHRCSNPCPRFCCWGNHHRLRLAAASWCGERLAKSATTSCYDLHTAATHDIQPLSLQQDDLFWLQGRFSAEVKTVMKNKIRFNNSTIF